MANPTPSPEDLNIAAEWLDVNEGEESGACKRVAEWLKKPADAKELRDLARAAGVPVSAARAAAAKASDN